MEGELTKAQHENRQTGDSGHRHQPLAKSQQSNDQVSQKDANAGLTFCLFYRRFRIHFRCPPVGWCGRVIWHQGACVMAKPATLQIKLVSTADTGYFYVTKKNPRTKPEKLELKTYDPRARKHVIFRESKIK